MRRLGGVVPQTYSWTSQSSATLVLIMKIVSDLTEPDFGLKYPRELETTACGECIMNDRSSASRHTNVPTVGVYRYRFSTSTNFIFQFTHNPECAKLMNQYLILSLVLHIFVLLSVAPRRSEVSTH